VKSFQNHAAQGDVYVSRVAALPPGTVPVPPDGDRVIVTHSETGHHHVMDADRVTLYRLPEEIYECFLVVREDAELRHLRPHDTHEPLRFSPGVYRVRRQREYVPEGFRRVED
jgi:hypothetical protein